MNKLLSRREYFLIIALACLILVCIYFIFQIHELKKNNQPEKIPEQFLRLENNQAERTNIALSTDPSAERLNVVMIDIKGAVKNPGVYEVEQNDRVIDAVKLAGGYSADSDSSKVNLAERLNDGMVIYIPHIGEEIPPDYSLLASQKENQVSINKAMEKDLETLPGIGKVKAKAIIQYRKENGPFTSIEQLKNVPGIGDRSFQLIEDDITIK